MITLGRDDLGRYRRDLLRGLARYRAAGLSLVVLMAIILVTSPIQPASEQLEVVGPADAASAPAPIAAVGSEEQAIAGGGGEAATDAAAAAEEGERPLPENCDPATGRVRLPSIYAPPCVHPVADNGGSTYRGVTEDEILVLIYVAEVDPAVEAIIRAINVADTAEDAADTYGVYADMFNNRYETYGRRIILDGLEASGPSDDDAAARRDAIRAINREPFAVIGGPPPFTEALAANGVIAITQAQRPQEFFEGNAPYVWGSQMSSTQVFLHLAEYIGKRLAGDNAIHAGDSAMRGRERKFGLVYLDDTANVYRPGVQFFESELAKYGVTLTDRIPYESAVTALDRSQEQARTIIARLKDRGVTSVLFMGEFLMPIYLTQEATNQNYFPEWVLSGGTLVDTIFVGRFLYDQRQWENAFGISQLWIRAPKAVMEPFYQHVWWAGYEPRASTVFEILYQEMQILFTGIHMAGPNLSPSTFRDGMFSYPPSGVGAITQLQRSWGNHGIWPFADYTSFDSVTEVWWDPNAYGPAEEGTEGRGMFWFVDGGRRYTPGQWPSSPPRVFTREGARTTYDELPPGDVYPTYPRD